MKEKDNQQRKKKSHIKLGAGKKRGDVDEEEEEAASAAVAKTWREKKNRKEKYNKNNTTKNEKEKKTHRNECWNYVYTCEYRHAMPTPTFIFWISLSLFSLLMSDALVSWRLVWLFYVTVIAVDSLCAVIFSLSILFSLSLSSIHFFVQSLVCFKIIYVCVSCFPSAYIPSLFFCFIHSFFLRLALFHRQMVWIVSKSE